MIKNRGLIQGAEFMRGRHAVENIKYSAMNDMNDLALFGWNGKTLPNRQSIVASGVSFSLTISAGL